MKTVGEILKGRQVRHVKAELSVLEVATYMTRNNIGAVCVMRENHLVGIFSERDLMQRVVASGRDPRATPVSDVMTTNLVVAQANENVRICLERMAVAGVRHLPVVSGELLVGMVAMPELFEEEVHNLGLEIQMLNDYVFRLPPPR